MAMRKPPSPLLVVASGNTPRSFLHALDSTRIKVIHADGRLAAGRDQVARMVERERVGLMAAAGAAWTDFPSMPGLRILRPHPLLDSGSIGGFLRWRGLTGNAMQPCWVIRQPECGVRLIVENSGGDIRHPDDIPLRLAGILNLLAIHGVAAMSRTMKEEEFRLLEVPPVLHAWLGGALRRKRGFFIW
ncbi:MAG: hypothetical protein GMKNLPBB_00230 [Myxococcota bacterium]|nr:hypothetical protein [Myxococcota bacterium]